MVFEKYAQNCPHYLPDTVKNHHFWLQVPSTVFLQK